MKAATEACEGWRRMPAPRRGEILFRVAERLMRDKETLARTVTREMGKVLAEAKGDVQEAIDMAYYMAAEGRRQFGLVVPSELPDKSALCVREPVGVVGLITPWNFPIAIPSWKTFPALILGNTVVLKPSPETPVTASLFVQVLEECGAPPGVVNLVLGSSPELGAALVRHPNVALISFTGSTATGDQVAMDAAAGHKRVALEMGGKNAILAGAGGDRSQRPRGSHCGQQQRPVRAVHGALHAGSQPGAARHAGSPDGDRVHQRRHDRQRSPSALRRDATHRQWPSRSGAGGAGHVQRMESDLRGLQRTSSASAD